MFNSLGKAPDETVGVNQLGISLAKTRESYRTQIDLLYGRDAYHFQSFMNEQNQWDLSDSFSHGAYAIAIPQLFVETTLNDWAIKAGHFLFNSTSGLYSNDRFFASRTFAETAFLGPHTLSGITAARQFEKTEMTVGWAAGANTGFASDSESSDVFVLGANHQFSDKLILTYSALIGDFIAFPFEDTDYYHELNIAYQLFDNLTLDVTHVEYNTTASFEIWRQSAHYKINDTLTLGERYESFVADTLVIESVSVGLNYHREGWNNAVLRPEFRWSKSQDDQPPTERETTFIMDAVFHF